MRQQQQQRSKYRNRGRKSSNPLSRNFESNGPDVKVRGNASHIAEKYSVLARDALTSGDTVMAENYFQHAEHYYRIVAAAQVNNPQSNTQNNSQRDNNRDGGNGQQNDNKPSEEGPTNERGGGPQPEMSEVPAEVVLNEKNTAAKESQAENAAGDDEKEERDSRTRRNGRRPASNRRTSRTATKKTDDASASDGASLPSSLIGASNEEKDAQPAGDE